MDVCAAVYCSLVLEINIKVSSALQMATGVATVVCKKETLLQAAYVYATHSHRCIVYNCLTAAPISSRI